MNQGFSIRTGEREVYTVPYTDPRLPVVTSWYPLSNPNKLKQSMFVLYWHRSVHRRIHSWEYRLLLADDHHWNSGYFFCSSLHLPQESTRTRRENCKNRKHTQLQPIKPYMNTQTCRGSQKESRTDSSRAKFGWCRNFWIDACNWVQHVSESAWTVLR